MPDTLHARLVAALNARLERARAAGGAPWEATVPGMVHVAAAAIRDDKLRFGRLGYVATVEHEHDRAHIAANDPAAVIRQTEALLRVVERHPHRRFASPPDEWPAHWKADLREAFPGTDLPYVGCTVCHWDSRMEVVEPAWWCDTICDLAAGEGIEVGE
jgi:hypothetical protein